MAFDPKYEEQLFEEAEELVMELRDRNYNLMETIRIFSNAMIVISAILDSDDLIETKE